MSTERVRVLEELSKIGNTADFFVSGMSSSGKDTISNYLVQYYGFTKVRIAGTIKQIICEKFDFTHDELEEAKRNDPAFRVAHHETSEMLGNKTSSMIRLKQLIERRAYDFNLIKNPENPLIICDVRDMEEAAKCLSDGAVGIFLQRTTNEFRDASHYTEQHMFVNGQLIELSNVPGFADNMIIVFNGSEPENTNSSLINKLHPDVKIVTIPYVNCTGEQLIEAVDEAIQEFIEE